MGKVDHFSTGKWISFRLTILMPRSGTTKHENARLLACAHPRSRRILVLMPILRVVVFVVLRACLTIGPGHLGEPPIVATYRVSTQRKFCA
jgi:hypothetical protein